MVEYKRLSFLGHPDYRVGTDGSVWSKKYGYWFRLTPTNVRGYLCVYLCKNNKAKAHKIHRLVLLAFVGPCPKGMQGCHFPDRDKSNNNLGNLRWDFPKGNQKDREYHGTGPLVKDKHPMSKLNERKVKKLIRLRATGRYTRNQLGKIFGISHITIDKIYSGKSCWSYLL